MRQWCIQVHWLHCFWLTSFLGTVGKVGLNVKWNAETNCQLKSVTQFLWHLSVSTLPEWHFPFWCSQWWTMNLFTFGISVLQNTLSAVYKSMGWLLFMLWCSKGVHTMFFNCEEKMSLHFKLRGSSIDIRVVVVIFLMVYNTEDFLTCRCTCGATSWTGYDSPDNSWRPSLSPRPVVSAQTLEHRSSATVHLSPYREHHQAWL